jgi:ribosomal protein L11 methyltransferase
VDYLELSLAVSSDAVDAAADLLREYAPAGVSIEPLAEPIDEDGAARIDPEASVRLRAWLPAGQESRAAVARLRAGVRSLDGVRRALHTRTVHDASWANAWKKHFRTLRIGRAVVIKPSWRTYRERPGDVLLELDPGMAFGTGQHATTQLCLEAIEEVLPPGADVLDVGCGSGILSIAAAKLGAAHVDALDIDPMAVRATEENAARNGVDDRVHVAKGSFGAGWPFPTASDAAYQCVLGNLSSRIVHALAADLVGALRQEGVLIASGMIEEQEESCRAVLQSAGGRIAGVCRRDGWLTLLVRRA